MVTVVEVQGSQQQGGAQIGQGEVDGGSGAKAVLHPGGGEIVGMDQAEVRITSYNVCYTKLLRWEGRSVLIDTATDFRQQALREGIDQVDAVLFTHTHADHVHGIDDLRTFTLRVV